MFVGTLLISPSVQIHFLSFRFKYSKSTSQKISEPAPDIYTNSEYRRSEFGMGLRDIIRVLDSIQNASCHGKDFLVDTFLLQSFPFPSFDLGLNTTVIFYLCTFHWSLEKENNMNPLSIVLYLSSAIMYVTSLYDA